MYTANQRKHNAIAQNASVQTLPLPRRIPIDTLHSSLIVIVIVIAIVPVPTLEIRAANAKGHEEAEKAHPAEDAKRHSLTFGVNARGSAEKAGISLCF